MTLYCLVAFLLGFASAAYFFVVYPTKRLPEKALVKLVDFFKHELQRRRQS